MLKKLYKYEFYSLFRILLPVYAAALGLSVLSRIFEIFKRIDSVWLDFFAGLFMFLSVLSVFALFIIGFAAIVVRFYQNLLTKQGYLTFTLPFKASTHINCKLICGAVVSVVNFVVALISVLIITYGNVDYSAALEKVGFVWGYTTSYFSYPYVILVIAEIIIALLLLIFEELLMYYCCMAMGQRFKNKIGGSVVVYFCIYFIKQIISTLIMVLLFATDNDSVDNITLTRTENMAAFQVIIVSIIIIIGLLATVYYFLTNHFLSKKLNLE